MESSEQNQSVTVASEKSSQGYFSQHASIVVCCSTICSEIVARYLPLLIFFIQMGKI